MSKLPAKPLGRTATLNRRSAARLALMDEFEAALLKWLTQPVGQDSRAATLTLYEVRSLLFSVFVAMYGETLAVSLFARWAEFEPFPFLDDESPIDFSDLIAHLSDQVLTPTMIRPPLPSASR